MRLTFHRLAVAEITALTPESVRVSFAVPEELRGEYAYRAGQHVTVRLPDPEAAGTDLRRSYSICAPPPQDGLPTRVSIAVKRQGPGGFGDHAVRKLAVGDELDVLTPGGSFQLDEQADRHIAIAAGSGITPILAIVGAALRRPGATAALIYCNRTTNDVMFLEELADLKDRYGDRFELLHVLSREDRGVPLLSGHVDEERLGRLLFALGENGFGDDAGAGIAAALTGAGPEPSPDPEAAVPRAGATLAPEVLPNGTPSATASAAPDAAIPLDPAETPRTPLPLAPAATAASSTAYYLCGPESMVESCRTYLGGQGVENIRFELFGAAAAAPQTRPAQAGQSAARLTVTLGGRTTECTVREQDPNLLAAVLRERAEAPFACTSGVCGTCRAKLTTGTVAMARDYALEPAERAAGFILTCQSLPTSDVLAVDFDS